MESQKKGKEIQRLFEFAGKYKANLLLSCLLAAISAICLVGPFISIWFIIREIVRHLNDLSQISLQLMMYYSWWGVGLAILGLICNFIALMLSHHAAFHTAKQIKYEVIKHLSKLPIGYFDDHTSGQLRKIIDENTDQTESFLAHQLPDLVSAIVTPLMILTCLFIFDWKLGLISVVPLFIGFIIQGKMMGTTAVSCMKNYQDALEAMNNEAVEYVRGIPVVKVFQQTVFSFKSFYAAIENYKDNITQFALSCRRPMALFTICIHASFVFLIPAGLIMIKNTDNLNQLALDFIFYSLFAPACGAMVNKIMYISNFKLVAEESVRRLQGLLDNKPMVFVDESDTPANWDISFNQVSFQYPGALKNAVEDLNFEIKQGTRTALVGPSGGGKSTIASLLARFRDVDEGQIKIGGQDIKALSEQVLMKNLAFVFQQTNLFKGTLYENIVAARPTATQKEVRAALVAAQCVDIVEKLPQGLDTLIGTKGIYLSGGEKQRIALARVILQDAPIVILDEATAFSDPDNEYKIQKALEYLLKDRTVIMIAHRLTTIQNVDQILVIDDGKVLERGEHKALLEAEGLYHKMWTDYQSSILWKVKRGSEAIV